MAVRTNDAGAGRSSCWLRTTRRLQGNDRGSVAVIVGLAATALVGMVGGAVDYAHLVSSHSHLQNAVDAGVMAGGNALKLVVSNTDSIVGLTTQAIQTEVKASPASPLSIRITVAPDKTSVTAWAEQTVKLMFGPFIGMRTMAVSARAKASIVGKMRLCMLALDPSVAGAFYLEKNAQVTAYDCALYSNSSSKSGMIGKESTLARAQTICSVGGFLNARANFTPNPQTGCPAIKDPLSDREAPRIEACKTLPRTNGALTLNSGRTLVDKATTLEPGTYCNGVYIDDSAEVTLKPGIYVFKDGPLIVKDRAILKGTDVGLYFTGDRAGLLFDRHTTISLSAPVTGPMAGLLMSEDSIVTQSYDPASAANSGTGAGAGTSIPATPAAPGTSTVPLRIYRIISDNARTMLGTIHLPKGRLVIDARKPVADMSAYTVVVARVINLYEGPNLYLNANYSASNVPVPKGVGPVSGRLLMTQ